MLALDGGITPASSRSAPPSRAMVAAKARLTMNVTKVLRGGDDVAVLYNDWRMTVTGPDGKAQESSGKAIEIVRRQADGSWKFVVDDPNARG